MGGDKTLEADVRWIVRARLAGERPRAPECGGSALPDSGFKPTSSADGVPMVTLEEAEGRHIEAVLEATPSINDAADVLGVSPTILWRRRRKHQI